MRNVIRDVFGRIGATLDTHLVSPKEEYQAKLLNDPLAWHSHDGTFVPHNDVRVAQRDARIRAKSRLNRAA